MTHRLFYAFKLEPAIEAACEVLKTGGCVTCFSNGGFKHFFDKVKSRLGEECGDINFPGDIYSGFLYDPDDPSEGNYLDDASHAQLIIILEHGNRTKHLATLLAKTTALVIFASQYRVKVKEATDEENAKWSEHSDLNCLYGGPTLPNFVNPTDAEHERYVRDGVSSLNDLIPVYDLSVKSFDHHEIVKMSIPERTPLVLLDGVPMLFAESITELYAWRGTGKTLFALALAYHLAAGESFLGMTIPEAFKVLYVEGELPAKQDQDRMIQLSAGLDIPEGNFTLLSKSFQGRDRDQSPVTIKTEAGRAAIEAEIERTGATVLILDSIASLAQISTNNEDNWIPIIEWLVDLRCKGICVIYLQQAGKGGEQRGHSISEDRIDQAIKLTATHTNPGAAAFEVSFHKPREQGKLDPFRVRCTAGVWERDSSRIIKSAKPKKPTKDELIREALSNDEPQRKIAKRLNVSLERISKIKKELQNAVAITTADDNPNSAAQLN